LKGQKIKGGHTDEGMAARDAAGAGDAALAALLARNAALLANLDGATRARDGLTLPNAVTALAGEIEANLVRWIPLFTRRYFCAVTTRKLLVRAVWSV
jgi:hypothetical protein